MFEIRKILIFETDWGDTGGGARNQEPCDKDDEDKIICRLELLIKLMGEDVVCKVRKIIREEIKTFFCNKQ
ncbi:MAG: hypothetical protein WC449_00670 [Candidatus Paceibacterota bacterium]